MTAEDRMDESTQAKSFRQLTPDEIDLLADAKELAERCGAFVQRLRTFAPQRTDGGPEYAPGGTLDQRWVSLGATNLHIGWNSLIRSITKPTTFY
jgi:hypothetical protein